MWIEDKIARGLSASLLLTQARLMKIERLGQVRTAVHLYCTVEEAARIRESAGRRQMSISDFVVFSLRRSWGAIKRLQLG